MKWLLGVVMLLVLLVVGFFALAPALIEQSQNQVEAIDRVVVTPELQAAHDYLRIADLHADTLLWNRNLLERSSRGHVDLPRLQAGNVTLQVFAAVTKSPQGQNYETNTADSDNITWLAVAQRWPRATWDDLTERALFQAAKLHAAVAASDGALKLILDRHALREHLAAWSTGGPVAGLLALEGGHPLGGKIENLEVLFDAGYRMIGLQHFFDNALGGSLHGSEKGGLTDFGRQVVAEAEAMGYLIDVAHSSPAVVDEVLASANRPIVVSHTGVQGACDSARNLSDEQMVRIARSGGLIGIGYWPGAVCDTSVAGVARAIKTAVDLLGDRAVALGSDYDGATTVSFDASELVQLTAALAAVGLDNRQIAGVMGENQIRFFLENLPEPGG